MGKAKQILALASLYSDLKSEEHFERRNRVWYRWVHGDGDGETESPTIGRNKDPLVDLVLSSLWVEPFSACRWMNTAPFYQVRYRVPYLHLPAGWSVSDSIKRKWGIQAVCSQPTMPLHVSDIVVCVSPGEVSWTCAGAREYARWNFRLGPDNSIEFDLQEVYD